MSEEQQAVVPWEEQLPANPYEEDFGSVTASLDFLPRLQLMISQSDLCKKGEFPVNHYALIVNKELKDLGKDVDVLVLAWRPKALDMSGDDVVAIYNPRHAEFARIRELSTVKDSGCMYGVEYLMWVPEYGYASFFMGSKSARIEAPHVKAYMGNFCTLKSHLIEGKSYSWQAPCVSQCSAPYTRPDYAEAKREIEKFVNPPETTVETVAEAEEER